MVYPNNVGQPRHPHRHGGHVGINLDHRPNPDHPARARDKTSGLKVTDAARFTRSSVPCATSTTIPNWLHRRMTSAPKSVKPPSPGQARHAAAHRDGIGGEDLDRPRRIGRRMRDAATRFGEDQERARGPRRTGGQRIEADFDSRVLNGFVQIAPGDAHFDQASPTNRPVKQSANAMPAKRLNMPPTPCGSSYTDDDRSHSIPAGSNIPGRRTRCQPKP